MSTSSRTLALSAVMGTLLLGGQSANAHISYNLAAGPISGPGDGTSAGPWTAGSGGYGGALPATWFAEIHNDNGVAASETVCNLTATCGVDSMQSASGGTRTLGTGAKSYKDGATNWGHSADFGLLELAHDATVTFSVSPDSNTDLRAAFGLWSGWDTGTGSSRHQPFVDNGAINPMASGVLGSSLGLIDSSAWTNAAAQGGTASLTLFLEAGKYTMIVGGYDGQVTGGNIPYRVDINAAAVPIPAAIWLFGSAVTGFSAIGRRQRRGVATG